MSVEVILPRFNMEMEEGTILRWIRRAGEQVQEGDPLCEVETDKVAMEVEAPTAGILCGLLAPDGKTIPVSSVIAHIADDQSEAQRIDSQTKGTADDARAAQSGATPLADPVPDSTAPPNPPAQSPPTEPVKGPRSETGTEAAPLGQEIAPQTVPPGPGTVRASPSVRRIARERGVDLASIADPNSRVTRAALEQAIEGKQRAAVEEPQRLTESAVAAVRQRQLAPVLPPGTQGPLDSTRRAIAARMMRAHALPDITLEVEVRARRLMESRGRFPGDETPSVTALLAATIARALQEHPLLNSTFESDLLTSHDSVNLGIAVARPKGLIVPVLQGVERLSILELSAKTRELVEKARQDRLTIAEVSGGTFTLTSLGEIGVDRFRALINPPQVAILAVGRIAERAVPIPGGIGVEPTVYLSLSCDHRVVDGAPAGEFLVKMKKLLEEPQWVGER